VAGVITECSDMEPVLFSVPEIEKIDDTKGGLDLGS